MKNRWIYLVATVSVVLLVLVLLHPRSRQQYLLSKLKRAQSVEEQVQLMNSIIELDRDSARSLLSDYSQSHPAVAFDPLHAVGLVADSSLGAVYEIGIGAQCSFSVGDPPYTTFAEIGLIESNDQVVRFVLRNHDKGEKPEYSGYRIHFDGQSPGIRAFDDVSPEDIKRWKAKGVWPFRNDQ